MRLNIGFLIGQPIGSRHDFNFDFPIMRLGEDFNLRDFTGIADFNRTPQGLFLQADFQGSHDLECVRCLETTGHILKMDFSELYAFDHRSISESGLLVPESGYIDLEPLLREYTLLEIPINPICKEDCKGLCDICGQNLNLESCEHNWLDANKDIMEISTTTKKVVS